MYIDIYSKFCIFYPGLDFVNTLKKPEARNVCIKQQDMGLAKISTIYYYLAIYNNKTHSKADEKPLSDAGQ